MPEDSDFSIDPHRLDVECLKHPELVYHYHHNLAVAKKSLEDTKGEMEALKFKLEKRIRDNPERYDIVKLTEGAVATYLRSNTSLQALALKLRELQHEVDLAWAAVNAISAKQQAITDLVKLHGQQYFSSPQTTPEGVDEVLKKKRKGVKKSK